MGQAKNRGTYAERVAQAIQKQHLVGFYWGYKADQGSNGFEFSNATCRALGMSQKETIELGKRTKDVVDKQLEILKANKTQELYGLTQKQFVDEEYTRMLGTTNNLNIITSKPFQMDKTFMQNLIIWCCAVSTCVAAGRLEQDEWNGDKFTHCQISDPKMKEILLGEEA